MKTLILAGQVIGFAPINFREVEIPGDGTLHYNDSNGHKRIIPLVGDIGRLFKEIWTNADGSRIGSVFGSD